MRPIDADALEEQLCDKAKEMLGIAEQCQAPAINYYTGAKYGFAKAAIIANGLPTIEPKRGKWLKTGQSFVYPDKFRNYFCSVCGFELDTHIRQEPNYCPHCGARMEMERSEE